MLVGLQLSSLGYPAAILMTHADYYVLSTNTRKFLNIDLNSDSYYIQGSAAADLYVDRLPSACGTHKETWLFMFHTHIHEVGGSDSVHCWNDD